MDPLSAIRGFGGRGARPRRYPRGLTWPAGKAIKVLPMAESKTLPPPLKVLFVCLANICRSPMAKAIAAHMMGPGIQADSAGVAPARGSMTPEALQVVFRKTGADYSRHVPRPVLDYPVEEYDFIIAMDSHVFMRLNEMPRVPKDRLYGWEVADPYGLGIDAYEHAARTIERHLERFLVTHALDGPAHKKRP